METLIKLVAELFFLYIILGLVCMTITEFTLGWLDIRSHLLSDTLTAMLGADYTIRFLEHPIIKPLRGGRRVPSYIPSRLFALAVFDLLTPNASGSITMEDFRGAVGNLPPQTQRTWMTLLLLSRDDLSSVVSTLEGWFSDVMDRVSGAYRRRVQVVLLVVALILTISLNINTITIANCSWAHYSNTSQNPASLCANPVGWSRESIPADLLGKLSQIFGWGLTVILLLVFAPLLFDLLSVIVNVRLVGRKPDPPSVGRPGDLV
jgi:hypothetical protein